MIAFVINANPDTNFTLSNTGVEFVFDSKTARTLTTSGTLRDISLSSTLNPYASCTVSPFNVLTPDVRVTSSC